MARTAQNFTFYKGNYGEIRINVEDVATLVGCKAWWCIADSNTDTPIFTKSTEGVSPKISFDTKYAIIQMDPSDTASLDAGIYYHELRVEDASDRPFTPTTGFMTLEPTIVPDA